MYMHAHSDSSWQWCVVGDQWWWHGFEVSTASEVHAHTRNARSLDTHLGRERRVFRVFCLQLVQQLHHGLTPHDVKRAA
jgi:hypothetical protein